MKSTLFLITAIVFATSLSTIAQRPPAAPPGGDRPGRAERPEAPRADRGPHGRPDGAGEWFKVADTNGDRKLDVSELGAAANATFEALDRDHNGSLDESELRPPRPEGLGPAAALNTGRDAPRQERPEERRKLLPPFFFMDGRDPGTSISKADFAESIRNSFAEMDKNRDGFLSREEARPPGGDHEAPPAPPPPPNAQFIGAEMRFGDKLVKGQPFSAETVIEDNRRLFDGTVASKQNRGAFFRDSAGRTRREQPLDNVGGFSVVGDDSKPQMLVFINDLAARTQYFLDVNNKVARVSTIGPDLRPEHPDVDGPEGAKAEALGTRVIEGVSCEGTRTTFEIPAGQIGNGKPIQVVSEKWYSPELQVVVLSRHLDPLAGEHIFKLVNIKRAEPSAELFLVPAGFRTEQGRGNRPTGD